MNFEDTKIYAALYNLPFHKVPGRVLELSENGREVNLKDAGGRTFLHHIAINADKFSPAQAVPVVYQLALAGIDLNAKDEDGDTAMHKLVKYEGAHRLLIALIRCGADLTVKDNAGKTVEEILSAKTGPPNSNPLQFWYDQFKPGLPAAAISGDIATTERLLKSWCRTRYWRQGRRHNIINDVRDTSDVPHKDEIIRLLEQYQQTTELAISVLAGSTKRISAVMQKDGADVNTQDVSYMYKYPNSPRVPQPLLAAAWEQDNYDIIDLLMTYKPDTSLVYVNHRWKQQMPLFFHALIGKPKPNKMSITNRIIRGSDLTRTDIKGQTILFRAIKEKMPVSFIKGLLKYGVDITSRDEEGQTARDVAVSQFQDECVECLDKQVFDSLRSRNMPDLDYYVMRGYGDVLLSITAANTPDAHAIQHDLAEKRNMKPVGELLENIPVLQKQMQRAYHAINEDNVKLLKKLIRIENHRYQNACGQTMLHWAVVKCNHDAITWLSNAFPKLTNICDNLLRSPLHYAVCLYGKNSQEARMLSDRGSSWELKDPFGRTPADYSEDVMGTIDHENLRRAINHFYTSVYVQSTNFDFRLKAAVSTGTRDDIEELIAESARHEINLGDYNEVLFDCIDMHRPGTALFLIDQGVDPDVYARYEACNPDDQECMEKKCRHPIVSLQERAEEMGLEPMAKYLDKYKSGQMTPLTSHSLPMTSVNNSVQNSAASSKFTQRSNLSTPFSDMANFGTFM